MTNINPFINVQAGQAASNAKGVAGVAGTSNGNVGQIGGLNNLNGFLQNLLGQMNQANNAGQITLPEGVSLTDLKHTLQQLFQGTVPAGTAIGTQPGQNDPAHTPASSSLEGLQTLLTNETNTALLGQNVAGTQADLTSPTSHAQQPEAGLTLLTQISAEIRQILQDAGIQQPGQATTSAVETSDANGIVKPAQPTVENTVLPVDSASSDINTPTTTVEGTTPLNKVNDDVAQEIINKIVQTLEEQGVGIADINSQISNISTLVQKELQQSSQTPDAGAQRTPLSVHQNASQPHPATSTPAAKTASGNIHPTHTETDNAAGVSPNLSASDDIESDDYIWRASTTAQQNVKNATGQSTASQHAAVQAAVQQTATPQAQQNANNISQKINGFSTAPALGSLLNSDTAGFDMSQNGGSFSGDTFTNELNAPVAGQMKAGIEGTQNNSFTNYIYNANKSAPAKTLQNLSMQIQKGAASQVESMKIQLQPLELGTVDIEMSFGEDGTVKAHMIVEKSETLALLQKDASSLEQSLKQAGIDLDHDALSFDLKQSNENDSQHADNDSKTNNAQGNGQDEEAEKIAAQLAIEAEQYVTETGVNLWV